jgi:DNA-binding NtrC family response regulator
MQKNVLIIGNDVLTRDSLVLMLSQSKLELRVASNVAESMRIIWAKAPDVIVVDLDIPGVDLKQFSTEAARMNENVCIVALYAHAVLPEDQRACARHVLKKPFAEIDVLRVMQDCLQGHKNEDPDTKNHLA